MIEETIAETVARAPAEDVDEGDVATAATAPGERRRVTGSMVVAPRGFQLRGGQMDG
jgi:hypothetical protein